MPADDKTAAPDCSTPSTPAEPPRIYFAACGAMCDIFWWARRIPPGDEPQPLPVKDEIP
ncbi:MAG: hypothetical protein WBY93_03800 [Candidatus Binatus sp.]